MTDKAINQAWIMIAILGALLAIVAVRSAPRAHCHDGTCHAHATGVN